GGRPRSPGAQDRRSRSRDRNAAGEAAQPLVCRESAASRRREDAPAPGRARGTTRGALNGSGVIPFASGTLVARRWQYFENLVCWRETNSSSDLARELMELYFGEDLKLPASVILAESQPHARGRKGDPWRAPANRGIYFTFVRPAAIDEPLSLVPIAVARWIRDAILDATGVSAVLKWPNDLYVGRRKLAGVNAESRTPGEGTYIPVGVGLNVAGPGSHL